MVAMVYFLILFLHLLEARYAVDGIEQSAKNDPAGTGNIVPVKVKRDVLSMICPSNAATSDPFGQNNQIILYHGGGKDNIISYGRDGWSQEEMKLLTGKDEGFNATKPTMIFVHGFHQSAWSPWLMDVRNIYDTILSASEDQSGFNFIFFDWSSYPKYEYWSSVSYVPYLGEILGEFLYELSKSYELVRVHLVAYSLSTHIIGLAGRYMANNHGIEIGQITALDPTGVCFQDGTEFGEENALRSTDAKLVVARHYNMGGLGAKKLVGGLDILVNGGIDQPRDDEDFPGARHIHDTNIIVMARQDHHRATEHETHTVFDEQCHQIAYGCDSYKAYLRGQCADCGDDGSNCFLVNNFVQTISTGIESNYKAGGKMFLKTHYKEPYCLHLYQIVAHLKSDTSASIKALLQSGLVYLDSGGGHSAKLQPSPGGEDRFSTLAASENKLLNPREVRMIVNTDNSTITETLIESVDHIEMNYLSNLSPEERTQASYKVCVNHEDNSLVEC